MVAEQLQRARQLILDGRIDEARAILAQLDHPTARKWLAKLDEQSARIQQNVATNSAPKEREAGLLVVLVALVALAGFVVAIYGAFVRPAQAASPTEALPDVPALVNSAVEGVSTRLDAVESSVTTFASARIDDRLEAVESSVTAFTGANVDGRLAAIETSLSDLSGSIARQGSSGATQWEYLVLQYSQVPSFDGSSNPLEFASVDRMEYMDLTDMGCEPLDSDCRQRNFKGMSYYIGALGRDSWEMVAINNTSSNSYSVEIFFKRPQAFTPDA